MLARFTIFLVSVLPTSYAASYNCERSYQPWYYIGSRRVPTSCNPEQVQTCPSSWKPGIPQGSETSVPMIYKKFLNCQEGFSLCGYVPIDPKSGEVLGETGVTIGAGVDLGSKSWLSFTSLSSVLIGKLDPYFGLKQSHAACAAIERPLSLTLGEANTLTDAVINDALNNVVKRYNSDKDEDAMVFASIRRGIRTAIVSVWYQFGSDTAHTKFWSFVTKNEWNKAINELRNFYNNPNVQPRKDLRRRNNEADIIEATLLECDRSVDVVFLIDESGSVSFDNFQKSLDFVKNMIKAFPNQKLAGKYSTRFGLSTFSTSYRSQFYLSSYTRQSDYLLAISRVSYVNGLNTNLGQALEQILTDQFSEKRGLRPEKDGLPRILIVLTDGKSDDSVSIPAKKLRDDNIVIYAIGVDSYDLRQLQEIASSDSHVYTLSTFSQLDIFISTLTSSTCYESRPTPLDETVFTSVAKNSYKYFAYEVSKSSNLQINVIDLTGSSLVYVSRTNPHPYTYDYDIAFDFPQQKNKVIVISPPTFIVPKTWLKRSDNNKRYIYVSVTSDTNSAAFIIKADECYPLKCKEGTNEMRPTTTITQKHDTPTLGGNVIATETMVTSLGLGLCIMLSELLYNS